jgi:hypothetical protein
MRGREFISLLGGTAATCRCSRRRSARRWTWGADQLVFSSVAMLRLQRRPTTSTANDCARVESADRKPPDGASRASIFVFCCMLPLITRPAETPKPRICLRPKSNIWMQNRGRSKGNSAERAKT